MPEFDILLRDGRTLTLDSPNAATANRDAATWEAQNPPAKADPLRGEPKGAPQAPHKMTADDVFRGTMEGGSALFQGISGAVQNAIAGVPFLPDIQAAESTIADPRMWTGKMNPAQAFQANRQALDDLAQGYSQRHPYLGAASQTLGTGATMFIPGGAGAGLVTKAPAGAALGVRLSNTGMNVARGATAGGATGAVYGLGSGGSVDERLDRASKGAMLGAALGGASGGFQGRTPKAPTRHQENVATLLDAGVSLTPGQRAGGLAKNTEDLAMRSPLLGPAIAGARDRGVESLNRSVALQALAPIGGTLPARVRNGNEAVAAVREQLGAAYKRAAAMVPRVAPDQVMAANLAQISARRADLAMHDAKQFERIVKGRVARLGSGTTGRQAMDIADELEGQAANYSSSSDGSQRAMGALIGAVAREIRGLIGRSSPQADALIQQADEGYTIYVRLRDAASKGKDGIATPSGLRTAVRTQDKSVGKGNVSTGDAALYDLANASHIMPDQFGNPGTGNAIGLGALLVGAPTAPVATAATATALGAAAAPYMMMGRQILESLPPNATRVQLLAAQRQLHQLAQQYPAVSALEQALALRLYQASGAGAASATAMSAHYE